MEGLRKAIRGDKFADAAIVVYADLCRAATYTPTNLDDPSALRLLIADLDSELKVGTLLLSLSSRFLTFLFLSLG